MPPTHQALAPATSSALTRLAAPLRRLWRSIALVCRVGVSSLRIAAIVAVHGLRYAVRRAVMDADAEPGELGQLRGSCIASLLERLGPTYVKLGQVLSARPDLVGVAVATGLSRLQEHVRAVPARIALRALRDGLGRDPAALFSSVEPAALACGSIAQVHRATTRNGRQVVVKIRRPDVVRRLEADVRLLLEIAALLERLGLRFPLRPWIREFTGAVSAQLDFAREAENCRVLAVNLAGIPGVRIPAVVRELSTSSVLTLEYLDELYHVDDERLSSAERRCALHTGLAALYQMIFTDGFIHADLHPGNVFFRRGGECALVDAGVIAQLAPSVRLDFIEFFLGLVTNRGDDCARIIQRNALYRAPSADGDAFAADVRAIVSRFSQLPARDFEVTAFATALFDVQHRHRVYSAPDFMMTIVALMTYEGIVKRVQPDLDFQAIARELLPGARLKALGLGVARSAAAGS